MSVKHRAGRVDMDNAMMMLKVLAAAAKKNKGVIANTLPVTGGNARQAAARLLRQWGLPVYAQRAGTHSLWYLLKDTDPPAFRRMWKTRIIEDCYAEVCRAHMAMVRQPFAEAECRDLATFAVVLGNWLGRPLNRVQDDLRPVDVPNSVQDMLTGVNLTLSP